MTQHRSVVPGSPRAFTARTWAVLLCVAGVLVASAAALWIGGAHLRSTPTADAVAEQFLQGATTGDAEQWEPVLSASLAKHVGAADSTPLLGDPALLDVVDLSFSASAARYLRTADAENTVAQEEADTAIVAVQLTYTFTGPAAPRPVDVDVEVVLSRAFAYDREGVVVEHARGDAEPTAVGPWRVSAVMPASDEQADDANSDTDPAPQASTCHTPITVLVDLSDTARIDGEISTTCILPGSEVTDLFEPGTDADRRALELPVLTAAHPISELLWSHPTDARVVVYRLDTDSGPLLALIAQQLGDADGELPFALVALRAMVGSS